MEGGLPVGLILIQFFVVKEKILCIQVFSFSCSITVPFPSQIESDEFQNISKFSKKLLKFIATSSKKSMFLSEVLPEVLSTLELVVTCKGFKIPHSNI